MKKLLAALLFVSICITGRADDAAKGFKTASVNIGYMPQQEFGNRVSVEEIADYIKKLQAACEEFFADATTPENLDIVVVARPDGKVRVWFVPPPASTVEAERAKLSAKLEAVPAPKVALGAIALALQGRIAGGDPKAAPDSGRPPVPMEWKLALANQEGTKNFDEILPLVWPGSQVAIAESAPPEGFVSQVLEPTGGHMLRPKDWFYKEDHHGNVFSWILSKEDTSKGQAYTTGVRVQVFAGVKKAEGKSTQQFIADFAKSKKKKGVKVIKACEPETQGLFTRQCLEIVEGSKHILYSLFWGNNDLDIAVIMTSESTKELWDSVSSTFDKMNTFDLIDMARFQTDDKFKVPPGVNYKEASPELNKKAEQLLLAKFSAKTNNHDILAMFQDKVICGPGLWEELKDDETLSKLEKGKVELKVNTQTLDGKLFQSPDEVMLFWRAFNKRIDLGDFKVRKLNQNELRIFWAIISFDIEEPVYILESDKHKILVYFGSGESPRIFWIDDLENIHLQPK